MGALDEIVVRLPTLTPAELEMLRARISVLLSLSSGHVVREEGNDAKWVLQSILDVLSAIGVEHVGVAALLRSPDYRAFSHKVPEVLRYLAKSNLQKNELHAAMRVGIELLYRNLVQIGVTTTSRTIMQHFHRVPAVLNKAFPGYGEAGMLGWIVRREDHARQERGDKQVPTR